RKLGIGTYGYSSGTVSHACIHRFSYSVSTSVLLVDLRRLPAHNAKVRALSGVMHLDLPAYAPRGVSTSYPLSLAASDAQDANGKERLRQHHMASETTSCLYKKGSEAIDHG
ncbi:unnamed protein product, partial [Musa banksii]